MGEVQYTPRGQTGYECTVTSNQGLKMVIGRDQLESDPEASGACELARNESLVRTLDAYAASELASRRTRKKEKKTAFLKSADLHRKVAIDLADLIDEVGEEARAGWCSGCLSKSEHRHVNRRSLTPDAWICWSCGAATTPCLWPGCDHFAVRKPKVFQLGKYCAEHVHAIPGFEKLDAEFVTLDDYSSWLDFDSKHAKQITTLTGGVLGGALVVAPLFVAAAPAIGGVIGAWGTGFSGAAASSHGLAMLGGGAIASGGMGVAGGTAVVTAAGAGLGSAVGASVSSSYAGDDGSFAIEQLTNGNGPTVVFSSGFLTENKDGWGEWQPMIEARYPDATVYRVRWGAKEQRDLRALLGREAGGKAAMSGVARAATRATKKALTKIGAIGATMTVGEIARNPWWVARTRANMTGAVLADLIARTPTTDYILIGHSLGARVMLSAAEALGARFENDLQREPQIQSVHLLGAAVGADHKLLNVGNSVTEHVWNYWSTNDRVLRTAYRSGEMGKKAAGATGFEMSNPHVKNRNVSRSVKGHSEYVAKVKLQ